MALSCAAENLHTEVLKLLLKHNGVKINLKDRGGRTALLCAAGNGHTEMVQLLLEKDGVKINLEDYYDQTPLLRAAENGHAEAVKVAAQAERHRAQSQRLLGSNSAFIIGMLRCSTCYSSRTTSRSISRGMVKRRFGAPHKLVTLRWSSCRSNTTTSRSTPKTVMT